MPYVGSEKRVQDVVSPDRIRTGQSLSSFVTVTNKLGDETIVVLGGDWESQ